MIEGLSELFFHRAKTDIKDRGHQQLSLEDIKALEAKQFPRRSTSSSLQPDGMSYSYYPPSHYFEIGLVTNDLLNDIALQGKTVLSMGAGSAYLERFVSENFHILRDHITLADLNADQLPPKFNHVKANMFSSWGKAEDQFDHIWFPHSVLIPQVEHQSIATGYERQNGWRSVFTHALPHLKPGGQIRATTQDLKLAEFKWLQSVFDEYKAEGMYSDQVVVVKKTKE